MGIIYQEPRIKNQEPRAKMQESRTKNFFTCPESLFLILDTKL